MVTPAAGSGVTTPTNFNIRSRNSIEFAKIHMGVGDARNVRIYQMPAIEHVYFKRRTIEPGCAGRSSVKEMAEFRAADSHIQDAGDTNIRWLQVSCNTHVGYRSDATAAVSGRQSHPDFCSYDNTVP